MRKFYRSLVITAALALGGLGATASLADPVQPNLVYIDGLRSGWKISGWATNKPETPIENGMRPILVNMAGWANIGFQAEKPFDIKQYKTLIFAIFMDGSGKQEFNLQVKLGDKEVSRKLIVKGLKQQWVEIDLPVKDLHVQGGMIDQILFSNPDGTAQDAFYIDNVSLE